MILGEDKITDAADAYRGTLGTDIRMSRHQVGVGQDMVVPVKNESGRVKAVTDLRHKLRQLAHRNNRDEEAGEFTATVTYRMTQIEKRVAGLGDIDWLAPKSALGRLHFLPHLTQEVVLTVVSNYKDDAVRSNAQPNTLQILVPEEDRADLGRRCNRAEQRLLETVRVAWIEVTVHDPPIEKGE